MLVLFIRASAEILKKEPEEEGEPEISEQDDLPEDNGEFEDMDEEGENTSRAMTFWKSFIL